MAITKEINIIVKETGVESINKKVENLNTTVKETNKSTKDFKATANDQTGGTVFSQIKKGAQDLIPALKGAESGLVGVGSKMWDLVKNPVGLVITGVVLSLKFLYEAFQSSVAGGKEIKAVFAGVAAVGDQVKDAVFGFARALINVTTAAYKFITLDFKGAAEDMKKANKEASNSYTQLTNAVDGTTFAIVRNLEKRQQANDKAKKMQAVTQSETNKLLVQSREILTDETTSIKEKKKALEDVTKAEKESSKEKVRIAAEDLKIIKEKSKAMGGEAEKKMKGEIRDATIALNEAETENAMTGIKLNKQKKMLLRQEVSDAKEAADAKKAIIDDQKAKAKEALKAEEEAQKARDEKRLEKIKEDAKKSYELDQEAKQILAEDQKNKDDALELQEEKEAQAGANKMARIKAEYDAEKKLADDKVILDNQVKDAKLDIANQTLSLISEIAGKGSKVAKAVAIAQATMSGIQGVQNAFTSASLSPVTTLFPAYPFIQAGLAGAFSALQIAKIAKGDKSTGGGSAPSAGGGSAPAAPSFNLVQGTGRNQIAESIGNQAPVKAFVVSRDMTTAQETDRNIVKSATL